MTIKKQALLWAFLACLVLAGINCVGHLKLVEYEQQQRLKTAQLNNSEHLVRVVYQQAKRLLEIVAVEVNSQAFSGILTEDTGSLSMQRFVEQSPLFKHYLVDEIALYSRNSLLASKSRNLSSGTGVVENAWTVKGKRLWPEVKLLRQAEAIRLLLLGDKLFLEAQGTITEKETAVHLGYLVLRKQLTADFLAGYSQLADSKISLLSVHYDGIGDVNMPTSASGFDWSAAVGQQINWRDAEQQYRSMLTAIYFNNGYQLPSDKINNKVAAYLLDTQAIKTESFNVGALYLSYVLAWFLAVLTVLFLLGWRLGVNTEKLSGLIRGNALQVIRQDRYEPIVQNGGLHESRLVIQTYNELLAHIKQTRVGKNQMVLEIGQRLRLQSELERYQHELESLVLERTRALQDNNIRLEAEIADKKVIEIKRRELSARLLVTQEQERKALSRELHDGLGPLLMTIKMSIQMLNQQLLLENKGKNSGLLEVVATVQKAIDDVRAISKGLRPVYYENGHIDDLLTWFGDEFQETTGIVVVICKDMNIPLPATVKDNLFRIYQEALNNAYKHAKASKIMVTLSKKDTRLVLTVADNGVGFNTGHASKGIGLYTMEERAALINGELAITPSQEQGLLIKVTVELASEEVMEVI